MLKHLRSAALTVVAVVALLLAAVGAPLWAAVTVSLVTLAGVSLLLRKRLLAPGTGVLGAYAPARSIVAAAVVVCVGRSDFDVASTLTAVTATAALAAVPFEPAAGRIWRAGTRPVANLPGIDLNPVYARSGGRLLVAGTLILALAAVGVLVPVAGIVGFVLAVAVSVVAGRWTVKAVRTRGTLRPRIAAALEAYAAPVMVYLSGPGGTDYQLGVWLPQLERLTDRVVVVVRETGLANKVAKMTSLPVVGAATLADLEAVQVPTFRVAIYVNNGAKNSHNVRYRDLTHVQLLHGDSDKPSSFNPVTAMFDKIFVAGQAGIDRYGAHGVDIPASKFEIVGRPQVGDIERPTSERRADGAPSTVLYGPTWTGFNADNNFGSLHVGTTIVRGLLERGCTVIFRPHPFSQREATSKAQIAEIDALLARDAETTGRKHAFGTDASTEMTLVDCFNASDALVSDVSSVPADYLFSEKPFVIVQVDDTPLDEFLSEFPLGRAAYVARATEPASVDAALDGLLNDTIADVRTGMRTYYLGDIPRETYTEVFPRAVHTLVEAGLLRAVERRANVGENDEPSDEDE